MLKEAELKRAGQPGPARLTRAVMAMAGTRSSWRRRLLIAAALACAAWLAAWIGVLAVTLPWRYRAGGWSAAWVGFDGVLFLAFAATRPPARHPPHLGPFREPGLDRPATG